MKKIVSYNEFLAESAQSTLENFKANLKKYDFFTGMIDSDKQKRAADQKNKEIFDMLKTMYKTLSYSGKQEAEKFFTELQDKSFKSSPNYKNKELKDWLGVKEN